MNQRKMFLRNLMVLILHIARKLNLSLKQILCYCLRSQVVSFVWAVIRSIVPTELLGTPSNWRMLRRNIARFIQLRRFEKFSLKKCMHKLKVSEFPFLSTQNFSCCFSNQVQKYATGESVEMHKGSRRLDACALRNKLLESWMFWHFSCPVDHWCKQTSMSLKLSMRIKIYIIIGSQFGRN